MAGKTPPLVFFPVAGSLIACCGITDVILYISTRKALVRSSVGMKGSKFSENESVLRRFRTGEERERAQSIKMNCFRRMSSDALPTGNGSPVGNKGVSGLGNIVISQTVVMNSEDSLDSGAGRTTPRREDSRRERSDSLRSLVGKKDGGSGEDFASQQKSWLA
jgi:hypothetical protein